jgi:NADH dehydrogenase [ubiquinone] 1 alpha subcomplex assembly factor 1
MLIFPLLLLTMGLSAPPEPLRIDFDNRTGADWQVIVDGVMGGLSTGTKTLTDNSMVFSGSISLANNGGFSSLRSPFGQYDLSNYSTVEVRYRATEGKYTFMFETNKRFYVPYFALFLPGTENKWTSVKVDLEDLLQVRLGEKTGATMSKRDMMEVIRIGFMKLDKQEGPFTIEIDYVEFR